ncbi:nodulation protein NfeD [Burkholderiaceae bacterium 26]|uniref:LysR family transcriptional regulator n=1 Tax=Ralstonia chuxiongensis TaxID=2957504 RepID=A0AA41WTK5_9RALS|nr:LysR family transcriptional regulator [Ralstonia chuxiongensis]KJJ96176.1 nodulation protein NfeD [Burkholderiaceae bacterium 26]MCP1172039.1 LysR family transcriptional regulator [Ralstonia chuxiongensis]
MRFNKLNLNLLVALDALLTEQNISRAAEKVHLSQAAMSNALARLREYFDDELLVQVGRKMELTARAEGLKDPVRDILVRIDATVAAQPAFLPRQSDRIFRLLVSDYTTMTLMPHLLRLAYHQAPGVRFELRPQVAYPERALERGEVDLLIIPKDYCPAEHPAEVVFEETFCCVLWDQSPLARGELTAERYMGAGHIVVQPGDEHSALEQWFMHKLGIVRRIETTTFSFVAPAHLLIGTDRIATMHKRLAAQAVRSLPITIRPVPVPIPRMEQSMQWHKHRSADLGLRWLRALIKEAAAAMDAAAPGASPPVSPSAPQP